MKFLLLGLLDEGPRHGYELNRAAAEVLADTWVPNMSQIYGALAMLERDGLVASSVVHQEANPSRRVHELTALGRKELERWLTTPTVRSFRLRDEFFLKVLVGMLRGGEDGVAELLWSQREEYVELLSALTILNDRSELHAATRLMVEGFILRVEADLKWLDLCEQSLRVR